MASLDDRPNDNVHDPSDIGTLPYSDVVRTRIVSTVYRYPVTPAYHRTLPGALLRVLLEGTPRRPRVPPMESGDDCAVCLLRCDPHSRSDPLRRLAQRIIKQMGISRCRLRLGVAEHLADREKRVASRGHEARVGVTEVV
jgi:hypothetical protein